MENSKRISRTLKKLNELEKVLGYYTNGTRDYSGYFKEIRELVDELSLNKKEDHIRLAKKLKAHWESSEKD